MANILQFVMAPEDEVAFFQFLERLQLEVYPIRIPDGWEPIPANAQAIASLPEDAAYLAAPQLNPIRVDKVKRGPDKGSWRVDEVNSPVIYYGRSILDEEERLLRSGRLWAQLTITPQTGRREAAPDRFRVLFGEVEGHFKKNFRRSEPKGFWIGPHAARAHKEGRLVLKDAETRGPILRPFR